MMKKFTFMLSKHSLSSILAWEVCTLKRMLKTATLMSGGSTPLEARGFGRTALTALRYTHTPKPHSHLGHGTICNQWLATPRKAPNLGEFMRVF